MNKTQLLDALLSLVFDPNLESMVRDALNKRAGLPAADLKSLAAREAQAVQPPMQQAAAAQSAARPWPTRDEVKALPRRQDMVKLVADFGMPIDTGLHQSPAQLRKDILAFIETAKAAEPQIGEVLVDNRQLELPVEQQVPACVSTPEPPEPDPVVEPVRATEAEAFAAPETVIVEVPKVEEPKVEEPKVEEPKVEEPKAEEPKAEEPKAEEPKVEEPKVEEPRVEEPKVAAEVPDVVLPPAPAQPTVLSAAERREDMIAWVKGFLGSAAGGAVKTKDGALASQKWLVAGASTPVQEYTAAALGDFMSQPQNRNELAVQKFWQTLGCAGNCKTCPHGSAQTVICYGYYESEALGRNGQQFLSAEEVIKSGECWIIEGKATSPAFAKTFKKEYTK